MKFRSTTGEDIHIALTNGKTALIGVELTELDKEFHKEAIARGALPEGVDADADPVNTGFNRKQAIIDVLNAMADGDTEGDFNQDGTPALKRVTAKLGFTASREEVNEAWAVVTAKAD